MPSFVTPPAPRLHYSKDGTVVIAHNLTVSLSANLSQAHMDTIDDEDTADFFQYNQAISYTANGSHTKYLTFLFPELRNLSGIFTQAGNITATQALQYSTDTTTGLDGTWSTAIAASNWIGALNLLSMNQGMRTSITALSLSNIKGLRIQNHDSGSFTFFYAVHLYGTKASNAGLSYRHPTLDQPLEVGDMDFGDVARGQTYTKTFRVKNNHATQTANGVIVSSTDVTGTGAWQFSIGGGGYQTSLDIGDLAAGVTSGVITCRRIVPGGETIRVQHGRLAAVPTSWT